MGIAAGVELDDRGAEHRRGLDLPGIGLDEQADPDSGVGEPGDQRLEVIVPAGGVEPAFGGHLLAPLGDDAGGVRTVAKGEPNHLLGRRHLEVQRQSDRSDQPGDVVVDDVAPVLAQMGGDPVGSGSLGDLGGADRIRVDPAARVADRRDMVDVDSKAKGPGHALPSTSLRICLRLPGFSAGRAASSFGSRSAS